MNHPPILFIIDDDPEDREIFAEVVHSIDEHIHLWESDDAEEALLKLRMAHRYVPDMIFLDLNMPKINGLECLQEIKQIDKAKHIPIYIYSTSSSQRDIDDAMQAGAKRFITKMSDLKELKVVLREILVNQ